MRSLDVFLVQMYVTFGKKDSNLEKVSNLVKNIKATQPSTSNRVIVLPELFSTGYDLQNCEKHAESIPNGPTTRILGEIAKQTDSTIISSYLEIEKNHFYNTAVIIDRNGNFIGKYRKIHLFPLAPLDETKILTEGGFLSKPPIFELEWGKIGVLICFDIRFPEISRIIAKSGAEIIFYLAEFPDPRRIVWDCLLQARAIENQVFICGVNRVGKDPDSGGGAQFFGHSGIVDPSGKILVQGDELERLLYAKLEPESLIRVKNVLDSMTHLKEHHY